MLPVFAFLTATTAAQARVSSAEDLGLLKPLGAWKVGTVDSPDAPYCAMVNKFQNGVVLAFSRDPAGHGAIAVDFNNDFFKPGVAYEVAMHADDSGPHRFSGRAGNDRSVVVQTSQDDRIYYAINEASSFEVALPAVAATFALRDFAESYASLVDCAAALPPIGPKTSAVPVPGVEKSALSPADDQPEVKLINERAQDEVALDAQSRQTKLLREALDAKQQELMALKTSSAEDRKNLAHAQAELKALKPQYASLQRQSQELADSLDAQSRQAKLLREALDAKEQELVAVKIASAEDKKDFALVRDELAALKPQYASVVKEMQAHLEDKEAQYALLRKQYESSPHSENVALAAELASQKAEVARLQKQLADAEAQRKAALESSMRAQADLASSHQQLAVLKSALAMDQERLARLQEPLKTEHPELTALNKKLSDRPASKGLEPHQGTVVPAEKPISLVAKAEVPVVLLKPKDAVSPKDPVQPDKASIDAEEFLNKIMESHQQDGGGNAGRTDLPVISGAEKAGITWDASPAGKGAAGLKFKIPPVPANTPSGGADDLGTVIIE